MIPRVLESVSGFVGLCLGVSVFCCAPVATGQSEPGTEKWRFWLTYGVRSSVAVADDGTVYIGSNEGKLYALAPDGAEEWSFETGETGAGVTAAPTLAADGTLYFGCNDNYVYALSSGGQQQWRFETGDDVAASPAIAADGTVYVGSQDGNVYALNPDGTEKWRFETGAGGIHAAPSVAGDGTVYVGTYNGNTLYALNPDGTEKWSLASSGTWDSAAAVAGDGTVYAMSDKLYAIDPDGSVSWTFETDGSGTFSSPAIGADGTVYVGTLDDHLYAVNPDGSEKWRFPTGDDIQSSPAVGADGTIYVGSDDDHLYAIHADGTQKWAFQTGWNVESSPAISPDGVVYVGSGDRNLYAIHGNSGGLADSSWPMAGHDLRRTGRAVGGPARPSLSYQSHVIDDDDLGGSSGNDDGRVNPQEEIELDVTLNNAGDGDAHNVSAVLSTSDAYTTITDNEVTWGDIAAGATDEAVDYDFQVAADCPDGHVVTFELAIESDEGTWSDSFTVTVHSLMPGDDVYEQNDTQADAYDLSGQEGVWLSAVDGLGVQSDDDWYQIEVSPGAESVRVDCRFTDADGDIDIELLDASGDQLADSTGTSDNEFIEYADPDAGTHYIRVYYDNEGNTYDLWWDDVEGGAPGTLKWSFETGGDIDNSSPAMAGDGTIYVGSEDSYLYAVNPDGTQKWRFETNGDVDDSTPAVGDDGTVYVGSYDNHLYAVNPDGSEKWRFDVGGDVRCCPALAEDGTVYVGSRDDHLYAVNADGTQKWRFETGGNVYGSPSVDTDGTVYVGSNDNTLYAIHPDGSEKWRYEAAGDFESQAAIGADGTLYVGCRDNWLYALGRDGILKWRFDTGDDILGAPAIGSDGAVYVGSDNAILYAVNPDGSERWRFEGGSNGIDSSPALGADGTIYVGFDDGNLYAVNPDGSEKWRYETGGQVDSSPLVGPDGTVYVGSYDNHLHAIHGDSGGLANAPWPMLGRDAARTGRRAAQGVLDDACEENDSLENAFAFESEDTWLSAILGGGFQNDDDWFAINAEAGTLHVNCQFTHADGDIDMQLVDAAGTVLADSATASDNEAIVHDLPAAGSYYILLFYGDRGNFYDLHWEVTEGAGDPGTQKWRFETGGDVDSSPAIAEDGTVYVGSYDHNLYAFNPDGTEKWRFQTGREIDSSPAIAADGTLYVGSWDDNVYAINPDGSEAWSFETGGDVETSPAIAEDGTVYIGSNDDTLYALNPDGTLKWGFETDGDVESSPAIGPDGVIYAGSEDDRLYAINPDGTEKWRFETGANVDSSPAVSDNGAIYVGSDDNYLYALDSDGVEVWRFETGDDIESSPALGVDGTIYVGSNDNHLYAINPDGTEKWRFETGDWVYSSPAVGTNGTIYVGADDNYVYAINPDGTRKWRFETDASPWSAPAIAADGTLYIGSGDNHFYAIRSDSEGPADSPWPMFSRDIRRTARSDASTAPDRYTVTLHPGAHGGIEEANDGNDYVAEVEDGAAFPSVTVAADAGYTFTGWDPVAPPTVTADFEATAQYDAVPMPTLTVTVTGNGTVTSTPEGVDCTEACSVPFAEGTQVTLTATPDDGWQFTGWTGGGCTGTADCQVTMTADIQVAATFEEAAQPEPRIAVEPPLHNFGRVRIDETSEALEVTMRNEGGADLSVGALALDGDHAPDFLVQNDGCSQQIVEPGGSCTVDILFAPQIAGFREVTLTIPSDDPDTPSLTVPLVGTADAADAVFRGDVNGDGDITAVDAAMALQIAGDSFDDPTAEQRVAADVTEDGTVTEDDAQLILEWSASGLGLKPPAVFQEMLRVPTLESVTSTIGEAGGEVALASGVTLQAAAANGAADTDVTLRRIDVSDHDAVQNMTAYEIQPDLSHRPGSRLVVPYAAVLEGDADPADLVGVALSFYDERKRRVRMRRVEVHTVSEDAFAVDLDAVRDGGAIPDPDSRLQVFVLRSVEFAPQRATRTEVVLDVPYFEQGAYGYCWACAATMAINYCDATRAAIGRKPWEFANFLNILPPSGLNGWQFWKSDRYGLFIENRTGDEMNRDFWSDDDNLWEYIVRQIDEGYPVVLSITPRQHVVLVVGYATDGIRELILHDSQQRMYLRRSWSYVISNWGWGSFYFTGVIPQRRAPLPSTTLNLLGERDGKRLVFTSPMSTLVSKFDLPNIVFTWHDPQTTEYGFLSNDGTGGGIATIPAYYGIDLNLRLANASTLNHDLAMRMWIGDADGTMQFETNLDRNVLLKTIDDVRIRSDRLGFDEGRHELVVKLRDAASGASYDSLMLPRLPFDQGIRLDGTYQAPEQGDPFIELTWTAFDGDVHSYRLFRFDPDNNKWLHVARTTEMSYEDKEFSDEHVNQYAVMVYRKKNEIAITSDVIEVEGDRELDFEETFPDPCLRRIINANLGRAETSTQPVRVSRLAEMTYVEELYLDDPDACSVASFEGLQYCTNVEDVSIDDGTVTDLSPLAELTKLRFLFIDGHNISDVSPLADLTNLEWLWLDDNDIEDISPLASLTGLAGLSLFSNQIEDISALAALTDLEDLDLDDNVITDISSLAGLQNVTDLGLMNNAITDIAALQGMTLLEDLELANNGIFDIGALVANGGLGAGDTVSLSGNNLDRNCDPDNGDTTDCDNVNALRNRGATVYW